MNRAAAIFVHGIFSSSQTWAKFRNLLSKDSDIATSYDLYFFDYASPKMNWNPVRRIPDLNAIADSLKGFIADLPHGHERVVIIAHSQGGLVVQRFLARMLMDGHGGELVKIRGVILFACPNSGSDLFFLLRRSLSLVWKHKQERELRPLNELVLDSQRRIIHKVVSATSVAADRCPIPITIFAGERDNIVTHVAATSTFMEATVLPGDHSSIIQPDEPKHRVFVALKNSLMRALEEPFPEEATPLPPSASAAAPPADIFTELTTYGPFEVRTASGVTIQVAVHGGPIDRLANIDIIVSSENIYFQMSQTFKPSISGRLRKAAARKSRSGVIIDDTAAVELTSWMYEHASYGFPVEPGTVAPTSSGDLENRGIKRIYHAAIVEPRVDTNSYDVNPFVISRTVHRVFDLAREERIKYSQALRSVCFPLFGAGRGDLDASTSFEWIWKTIENELTRDDTWVIHFISWRVAEVEMLVSRLRGMVRGST